MSQIFISHSSANDAEAIALRDWLIAEGWSDLFLDLDPSRGIAAGERWERALNEAAKRCEAVIILVSKPWLESEWCRREWHLARRLNKRIFGMLVEDIAIKDLPRDMTSTWQLVSLISGSDHHMFRATLADGKEAHVTFSLTGLQRLKAGLTKAGLNARFFAWPPDDAPDRPPYRGLKFQQRYGLKGDPGLWYASYDFVLASAESIVPESRAKVTPREMEANGDLLTRVFRFVRNVFVWVAGLFGITIGGGETITSSLTQAHDAAEQMRSVAAWAHNNAWIVLLVICVGFAAVIEYARLHRAKEYASGAFQGPNQTVEG